MRVLITIIAIFLTTNVKAQTTSQRLASLESKVTTLQKDVIALKADNVKMKAKLDSLRPLIVLYEKSQFNVSNIIKGAAVDTQRVQIIFPIR